MKKIIILLCCFAVAIPVVAIGRFYLVEHVLPTPNRTINRYFDYISKGEYEKAYEYLRDPFKSSRGEGLEDFIAMFELSKNHGTVYQGAKVLKVMDTDRRSVKLIAFELHLREKGRPTKSNGAYYLEKSPETKKWYIIDSQM